MASLLKTKTVIRELKTSRIYGKQTRSGASVKTKSKTDKRDERCLRRFAPSEKRFKEKNSLCSPAADPFSPFPTLESGIISILER